MEKIIPVVVLNDLSETVPCLQALSEGGIFTAEITFRTPCAADAIALAARKFPDMRIGAGTVISARQCKDALDRGAQFIVSPGLSEDVAAVCRKRDAAYYPGCVTPGEIMRALDLGITTVKFFPANIYGGLNALKALSAPFPQVRFIPTGGIDNSNLAEFLAFDRVAAVGGSWMMKGDIALNSSCAVQILKASEEKRSCV